MKIKIALAMFACSGALLALLPASATAAPLSGLSQDHGLTMSGNTLVQKVHRWWRRGWAAPYYGYGYGYGQSYYRPYYPAYRPYYYGYYAPPPPPPPYYYRPYWGPYY